MRLEQLVLMEYHYGVILVDTLSTMWQPVTVRVPTCLLKEMYT